MSDYDSMPQKTSVEMDVYMNSHGKFIMPVLSILLLFSFYAEIQSKPAILFAKSRVNWAWGYVHAGWCIESTGAIDTFHFKYSDSVWAMSQDSLISDAEMTKMTSLVKGINKTVSQDTLKIMSELISLLSLNDVKVTDGGYRDFGVVYYSAFLYDSSRNGYIEIPLSGYGDQNITNNSAAAITIVNWLSSIDSLMGQTRTLVPTQKTHYGHLSTLRNFESIKDKGFCDVMGRHLKFYPHSNGLFFVYTDRFNALMELRTIKGK
jgi:hypothetical protein